MTDAEAIAAILVEEFEAAPAHARAAARKIVDRLFGEGADNVDEPLPAEIVGGRCAACGHAVEEYGGIAFDDERNEVRFGGKFVRNLTGQESTLFRMLLDAKGRTLSKEQIIAGLYAKDIRADGEVPHIKIVDVFVCKMKKKIKPLGLDVGTSWGRGYFLREPACPTT